MMTVSVGRRRVTAAACSLVTATLLLATSSVARAGDLVLHTQVVRMSAGWSPFICSRGPISSPWAGKTTTDYSAEVLSVAVGREIGPNVGMAFGTRLYEEFTAGDFFSDDEVRGYLPLCVHLVSYRKTGRASSLTGYATLDVNPRLWLPMEQHARVAVGACWTGWGALSPGIETSWRRTPIFGDGYDRWSIDVTLGLGGWLYIAND